MRVLFDSILWWNDSSDFNWLAISMWFIGQAGWHENRHRFLPWNRGMSRSALVIHADPKAYKCRPSLSNIPGWSRISFHMLTTRRRCCYRIGCPLRSWGFHPISKYSWIWFCIFEYVCDTYQIWSMSSWYQWCLRELQKMNNLYLVKQGSDVIDSCSWKIKTIVFWVSRVLNVS